MGIDIMIKIVEGDLLQASEDIIGHQVNCKGVMGGGVALQIKNTYPLVYEVYKLHCNGVNPTSNLLGDCQIVPCKMRLVANLFGQDGYGIGKQYTDLDALRKSLIKLKDYAQDHNNSVALPYLIGCGLGGGNWDDVYKIIDDVFIDYEVTLYRFMN